MARIATSAIIADIRGKSATQIFSRNHYGAYVKGYTIPVEPNTAKQLAQRSAMTDMVENWKVIEPENREKWIRNANLLEPIAKRFPHKQLTGYNLYARCQLLRQRIGVGVNNIPGAITAGNEVSISASTLDEFTFSITLLSSFTSTAWRTIVFASNKFNPGKLSPNGCEFKYITNRNSSGTGNASDIKALYTAIWGTLEAETGKIIWLRFRNFNITNGQQMPYQYVRLTIA